MIEYSPSIFITVFNFFLPMLFIVLVSYERLEAGRELISILFWRFFLRLFSLVIAFVAVYNVVSCDYALGCEDDKYEDQGRFLLSTFNYI